MKVQLPIAHFRGLALLLSLVLLSGCSSDQAPDLILTNANVYTMSWSDPSPTGVPSADAPFSDGKWMADAEAVAMRNGKIVAVGSAIDVMKMAGSMTRVIDLNGATVLPGLIESHGHLHELGEKNEEVVLVGAVTEQDLADRLTPRLSTPEGEWIVGSGWDEGEWANALPTRQFITDMFPNNPVVLKGLRGFGTLGNDAALAAAGITESVENPVGGELVRDASGRLTGVLLNNATDLLNDAIPERTLTQKKAVLNYGIERLLESGFVTTHHAGVRTDYLPAYQSMAENDELRMRVEAMLSVGVVGAPSVEEWTTKGPTTDPESMLQIRSVKAYYDASLGSRGARLIEDYSDMPGHRGVSGVDYGFDEANVAAFMKAGFQAGIHAIGDAGNREVLDFYEKTFANYPETQSNRHRIEHAQVVHPDDFQRLGAMGIVASMEPGHAVEDSPWAEERVGPERIQGAYAWRTMRQNGVRLIFNSDFTGTDWSFFYGVYAAVTRKQKDGTPADGWYSEQAVTPEEAVRAYTVWPAYASQRESLTGTIAVGKWADITVMDIDPFNTGMTQPELLLTGKVIATIVRGRVEYEGRD